MYDRSLVLKKNIFFEKRVSHTIFGSTKTVKKHNKLPNSKNQRISAQQFSIHFGIKIKKTRPFEGK
jgi:hypothetical protein